MSKIEAGKKGREIQLGQSADAPSPKGPTAKQTGEILGISQDKVKKARTLLDRSPEKVLEVKKGEKTINKAYTETMAKKERRKG